MSLPKTPSAFQAKDLRPLPLSFVGRTIQMLGLAGNAPLLLLIQQTGQCKDDELPRM